MDALRKLVIVIAAWVVACAAALVLRQQDAVLDGALDLYAQGRYVAAYARFAAAADQGNPEAARMALQMVREGRARYGTEWWASPAQRAHWARLAGVSLSAFTPPTRTAPAPPVREAAVPAPQPGRRGLAAPG
ncbi:MULTISPECIES: hypothetical protein [Ramlibacter]|uniref:Uncharacterized protein n=1 Tax=Ramlibacter aquaticus TaxID=2780094 RepID=A0ABR9SAZ5_9BURK|nr:MULTISPECIES: hypothetical protein [Ramlibacter]MBE7939518.1 hypothetical protein [Ramlibacter aquaticus]